MPHHHLPRRPSRFGLSSYDEMCYNFVLVYDLSSSPAPETVLHSASASTAAAGISSPAAGGASGAGGGKELAYCVSDQQKWGPPGSTPVRKFCPLRQ